MLFSTLVDVYIKECFILIIQQFSLGIRCFFTCFLLCNCIQVKAGGWKGDGWFEVDNYEGKIGESSVHLSLQRYTNIHKTNAIDGVYYNDRYRLPILVYGIVQGDDIFLCEFKSDGKFDAFPKRTDFTNCEFKLETSRGELVGQWKNKASSYPVKLTHTNSLNDTDGDYIEKEKIEIPFWGQTHKHSFIGVYEMMNGKMEVNKINVVNKKDGEVIQIINPQLYDCGLGFYITSIYRHVVTENDTTIRLNCEESAYADRVRFYQYDKKKGKYIYIKDYYDKYYK